MATDIENRSMCILLSNGLSRHGSWSKLKQSRTVLLFVVFQHNPYMKNRKMTIRLMT